MSGMFTDSIEHNFGTIEELLKALPISARRRAMQAGQKIEKAFNDLTKDHPNDNAVALGTAYAIYFLAQRMVGAENAGDRESPLWLPPKGKLS